MNTKTFQRSAQYGRNGRILKAAVDYAIVLPSLLFLAPLFLLIALLIKFDSLGPIFHRRRVLGQGGNEFDALTFRTMYINGEHVLNQNPKLKIKLKQNYKLTSDPRITPVGYLLCKLNLQELPLLLNVLAREMSLVGPRVMTPGELSNFGEFGDLLLQVKPGLTGAWQVNGVSIGAYDARIAYDLNYIFNWSVWIDLKILFKTVPAVFKG